MKPVDAVRQVDGVHHADDEEEREDVKEPAEVHRAQQRQRHDGGQRSVEIQRGKVRPGDEHLRHDLIARHQAQVALFHHLDIVVHKAHQAEGVSRQHADEQRDAGAGKPAPQQAGHAERQNRIAQHHAHKDTQVKRQTAHGRRAVFALVPGGADLLDGLAEVKPAQRGDDQQAGGRCDRQRAEGRRHKGIFFHNLHAPGNFCAAAPRPGPMRTVFPLGTRLSFIFRQCRTIPGVESRRQIFLAV